MKLLQTIGATIRAHLGPIALLFAVLILALLNADNTALTDGLLFFGVGSLELRQRLGVFGFQPQPIRVPLPQGVNIHAIEGRLTGRVDIVGGAVSGTLRTEGVERLIRSFRIRHDGDDRVGLLNGRQLAQFGVSSRLSIEPPVNLPGAGIAADQPVNFDFVLPIALPWLAQPALTAWPWNMPVRTELAIFFEWETAAAGGASQAGTGALISGGDRAVTFDQGPLLELTLVYSTGKIKPWYLTRYTPRQTEQFSAANAQLPFLLNGNRRIAAQLVRALNGADQDKAELVTDASLLVSSGALRYFDRVNYTMLQRVYQGQFPAIDDLVAAERLGQWFHSFSSSGLLGTVLDPRPLANPEWQFNVAAPVNPGVLDIVLVELDVLPGVTQMSI